MCVKHFLDLFIRVFSVSEKPDHKPTCTNNFGQAFNRVIPVPALRAGAVSAVCGDDVGAASELSKPSKRKKDQKSVFTLFTPFKPCPFAAR